MSLTRFLDQPEIKEVFKKYFKKPRTKWGQPLLVSSRSTRYGVVGTAFDYLLRFEIARRNPEAHSRPWLAETGAVWLTGRLYLEGQRILDAAKELYIQYQRIGIVTDELLQTVIGLGLLEGQARSYYPMENLDARPGELDELGQLLACVPDDAFIAKDVCVLNPAFGEIAKGLGGADADLIIDDMLIDVKTTKNLTFTSGQFNQLMGYYALIQLDGVKGLNSKPEIKQIAVYYSRHAVLHKVRMSDILADVDFEEFLDWFRGQSE